MATVDYMIIGQGLAGSAVALQLLKLDKKILVIDDPSQNNSSLVAAGMFNPVTGKNMLKTWQADILFPYLHRFYREAEDLTGQRFFFPMPLYRPFISAAEQNEWMGRSSDPSFRDYIEAVHTNPGFAGLRDKFGGIVLKQCGFLNTSVYTEAVRSLIRKKSIFNEDQFRENALAIKDDKVNYEGIEAERIIFCQGVQALSNRWFGKVPLKPLKGEVLTIKCSWKEHVILNRGVYIVPGKNAEYLKVGATYNFEDHSPVVTDEARKELTEKLNELVHFPYEIVGQEWGLRPTTPDRKPILGEHPVHKSLVIFNGLGTKGVSLAPYFSEVLIRWILNTGTLSKDINVSRFKLLY